MSAHGLAGISAAPAPTGMVTFAISGMPALTAPLNPSGQAAVSTALLTAGQHTVTATYHGDVDFAASSSAPVVQTVAKATTTTTLTAVTTTLAAAPARVAPRGHPAAADSGRVRTAMTTQAMTITTLTAAPSPSVFGQPVTLTATVTVAPDYVDQRVLTDDKVTLTLGQSRSFSVRLDSTDDTTVTTAPRPVLWFMLDTTSPVRNLKFTVSTQQTAGPGSPGPVVVQLTATYNSDVYLSLHRALAGMVPGGTYTLTFRYDSGTGGLRIGDVVVWWKRY